MLDIQTLIAIADAYKSAAKIGNDSTVSHRVFGDTKKLAALRRGADITVGRFSAAVCWFRDNWPEGEEPPAELIKAAPADPTPSQNKDAAA